ncbi:hypothetical protein HispidOSU_013597 [Sigmodon hispidus]
MCANRLCQQELQDLWCGLDMLSHECDLVRVESYTLEEDLAALNRELEGKIESLVDEIEFLKKLQKRSFRTCPTRAKQMNEIQFDMEVDGLCGMNEVLFRQCWELR